MKKNIIRISLIFIAVLLIINPNASIKYAREGLSLCAEIIVPSLFPFFVCSGLLIYSGFCEIPAKLLRPVMKPLFNVNGAGAAAFVLGLMSGYPLGAITVCNLYESLYISKNEAERMLAFCNNSGPLFILGAVGTAIYHNPKIGIILYVSHIFSAVAVGIAFGFCKRDVPCAPPSDIKTEEKGIAESFRTALSDSVQSILTVCGAVVFFSSASKLILDFVPVSENLKIVISALLEFSGGVNAIAASSLPLLEKLALSAAVVGFAGLCVHLQVLGIAAKHSLKLTPYIVGKAIQGIVSACLAILLFKLFPPVQSVFSPLPPDIGGAFAINSLFVVITAISVFFLALSFVIFEIFKKNIAETTETGE